MIIEIKLNSSLQTMIKPIMLLAQVISSNNKQYGASRFAKLDLLGDSQSFICLNAVVFHRTNCKEVL